MARNAGTEPTQSTMNENAERGVDPSRSHTLSEYWRDSGAAPLNEVRKSEEIGPGDAYWTLTSPEPFAISPITTGSSPSFASFAQTASAKAGRTART